MFRPMVHASDVARSLSDPTLATSPAAVAPAASSMAMKRSPLPRNRVAKKRSSASPTRSRMTPTNHRNAVPANGISVIAKSTRLRPGWSVSHLPVSAGSAVPPAAWRRSRSSEGLRTRSRRRPPIGACEATALRVPVRSRVTRFAQIGPGGRYPGISPADGVRRLAASCSTRSPSMFPGAAGASLTWLAWARLRSSSGSTVRSYSSKSSGSGSVTVIVFLLEEPLVALAGHCPELLVVVVARELDEMRLAVDIDLGDDGLDVVGLLDHRVALELLASSGTGCPASRSPR